MYSSVVPNKYVRIYLWLLKSCAELNLSGNWSWACKTTCLSLTASETGVTAAAVNRQLCHPSVPLSERVYNSLNKLETTGGDAHVCSSAIHVSRKTLNPLLACSENRETLRAAGRHAHKVEWLKKYCVCCDFQLNPWGTIIFMEQEASIMLGVSLRWPTVMPDASDSHDRARNTGRSMGVGTRTLPKWFSQGWMWSSERAGLTSKLYIIHWTMWEACC